MVKATYRISGRVIDRKTGRGVPGLRVEAWDKDTKYHDMLGVEATDARGSFQLAFDEAYFGDFAPDRLPDLFFKVFSGRKLITSTEDSVMWNVAPGDTSVTIEIDVPQPPPARRDRVQATQVLTGIDFVKHSDFKGIGRETRDRTSIFGGVLGDMVKNRFAAGPLQSPQTRARDVVGQDVAAAESSLAARQVTVNSVKAYEPGLNTRSLATLTRFPVQLKPGDKVDLYKDEQGKVRYYSVVRDPAVGASPADVERLDTEVKAIRSDMSKIDTVSAEVAEIKSAQEQGDEQLAGAVTAIEQQQTDLARLDQELKAARKESAAKDAEIAALREEVTTLRADQAQFMAKVSPDRIKRIEDDLKLLGGGGREPT